MRCFLLLVNVVATVGYPHSEGAWMTAEMNRITDLRCCCTSVRCSLVANREPVDFKTDIDTARFQSNLHYSACYTEG